MLSFFVITTSLDFGRMTCWKTSNWGGEFASKIVESAFSMFSVSMARECCLFRANYFLNYFFCILVLEGWTPLKNWFVVKFFKSVFCGKKIGSWIIFSCSTALFKIWVNSTRKGDGYELLEPDPVSIHTLHLLLVDDVINSNRKILTLKDISIPR